MGGGVKRSRVVLRSLYWRLLFANVTAGVFVTMYLFLTVALPSGTSRLVAAGLAALAFVALSAALGALGFRRAVRIAEREWSWVDEGRPPTGDERRAILAAPWRTGLLPLRYWAVITLLSLPRGWEPDAPVLDSLDRILFESIVIMLGGISAGVLGYFLAEDTLRPFLAEALHGEPPEESPALGLRPRLMLAWGLGSGIPLAGILVTPFVREGGADIPIVFPVALLAVAGLVSGAVLSRAAGQSIATPLERVRGGLRQVREGKLDAHVVVDDGGDIGLLQAGFNRMVDELRERQRVQELFGRQVGAEVARNALERGPELGGELLEVSVFFIDITGSTTIAQRRPAAEVVALLNDVFEAVVRAAEAEGGWVNKFEGDAALCVFGAPGHQPDHAVRALRAARDLRRRLAEVRTRHHDLDAGIGVSSGEVVAGHVGSTDRYEYTVIGLPVNEASRLTEAAKECDSRLLAAATTVEAADAEARWWHTAGTVTLRGVRGPVAVYEPVA